MFPQLFKYIPDRSFRLLIIIGAALITSSCATSGAKESEETDIWAAYSVDEILEAGDDAFESGQTERAVFIYMQALEIEQSAETWYRIGLGKARLGDKAYAWQALKQAVEMNPDHALSHQELGLLNIAMGEPEQAELHLAKATNVDPTLWRSWNARGVIADIDHRYAEAVLFYQSGLIGAPNSALLMNNIGYSYYLAGDLEDATQWFGRAIMASPDYKPAVTNLALLYARQGWYDRAVKTLDKVVGEPQAYNDTGYIAMRNGDYWEASELLSEAIRLSPTYYEKAYQNLEDVKEALKNQGNETAGVSDVRNISQVTFPDGNEKQTRTVIPGALNVRAGPSSDSRVVNYLRGGNEVEIIMTLPGWAFVNYRPGKQSSNLTGWVNSEYLSEVDGTTKQNQPMAANRTANSKVSETPTSTQKSSTKAATAVLSTTVVQDEGGDGALLLTPGQPTPTASAEKMTAAAKAALEIESVIKSIDAVCDLGDQAQKTPHTAGSCIGVASADADE